MPTDTTQANVTMNAAELTTLISDSLTQVTSQLASATLSSAMLHITPPQFAGTPRENIHEWVEKWEQLTNSFPDDQKTALLNKAFLNPARAWFKGSLKPKLPLPWRDIKKLILEQFSGESQEDRSFKKLMELTYDQQKYGTLSLYLDDYAYTYKKAYPRADEPETVRAIVRNLTPTVRHKLNQMTDLKEVSCVETLRKLTRRYDQEPEATDPKTSHGLDVDQFKELMSNVVKDLVEKQAKQNEEILAAFRKQTTQPLNVREKEPTGSYHKEGTPATMNQENSRAPYRQNYRSNEHPIPRGNERPIPRANRPPPSPCYFCEGDHWNADCPNRPNRLNSRGR